MLRHLSLYILLCVIAFSFFIKKDETYYLKNIPQKDLIYFEVHDVEVRDKITTIYGKDVMLKHYGRDNSIKPGQTIKIQKLDSYVKGSREYRYYINDGNNKNLIDTFKARDIEIVDYNFTIYSLRYEIREFLAIKIEKLYGEYSDIIKALLYGERYNLDKNIKDNFDKTGISHILSLSGFHVGIIALILNTLLKKVYFRTKNIIIICALIFYAFITGLSPTIIRSVAFFCIYYLAFLTNKRYSLLSTSFVTATIFLTLDSYLLYNKSFVLSFLGVTSIALFNPILRNNVKEHFQKNYFINIALTTLSAQILLLPISVYYFGVLPIYSIFANIIAIPLITLTIIMSTTSICLSLFDPIKIFRFLTIAIADIVIFIQKILFYTIDSIANVKYSYIKMNITIETTMCIYGIILIIYLMCERRIIKENVNDTKTNIVNIT